MPEPIKITIAREKFDLDVGFTSSDLKSTYRCLAQIFHPDRFDTVENWKVHKHAEKELKSINSNYKLLQDWLAQQCQRAADKSHAKSQRKPNLSPKRKRKRNQSKPHVRSRNGQANSKSHVSTFSREHSGDEKMHAGKVLILGVLFVMAIVMLGIIAFWEFPIYQKLPNYTPPPPLPRDKLLPSKQKLPDHIPNFDKLDPHAKAVALVPMRDWLERDGYFFIAELVSIHLDGDKYYWGVFRRRTGEEKYLRINELSDDDAEVVRREVIAKGIFKP
ncbi:MAG: hypothetical protein GXP30_01460, partial [Verrucomicrobia bacterium]|nr:hypothetical protein [Verrucomicrobiota bacterium]